MKRCQFPVMDEAYRVSTCRMPATTTRAAYGDKLDVCDLCAATIDARPADPKPRLLAPKPKPARLDFGDQHEVAEWLMGLRIGIDDMDGVTLDMLKPARERELGPVLAARNYAEARETVLHALAYAEPPEPDDGEPSDPAGSGGAGPTH